MGAYILIFGVLAVFALTDHIREFKQVRYPLFISCSSLLVFFAGLRQSGVGPDDVSYVEKFLELPDVSVWIAGQFNYVFSEIWMEPGYIFVSSTVRLFTDEYSFLFLTMALISVGTASYNYYRYTPFVFLALVLFFVHTYLHRDINQIRSAVAAAIGLFLVSQIHHREHLKVILTIGIAGLFHMASFCLVLVYLMSFLKFSRARIVFIYAASLFSGIIGISSTLLSFLPDATLITTKLLDYGNSEHADTVSIFDITNLKNSALLFILVFYWRALSAKVKFFQTMMLFYCVAVSWRIAFSDFGIFAARIATFFGIVEVVLIPGLVFLFRKRLIATILILVYAFATLYLNLFVSEGRNPYQLSWLG